MINLGSQVNSKKLRPETWRWKFESRSSELNFSSSRRNVGKDETFSSTYPYDDFEIESKHGTSSLISTNF